MPKPNPTPQAPGTKGKPKAKSTQAPGFGSTPSVTAAQPKPRDLAIAQREGL